MRSWLEKEEGKKLKKEKEIEKERACDRSKP